MEGSLIIIKYLNKLICFIEVRCHKLLYCFVFVYSLSKCSVAQQTDSLSLTSASTFNMFREPSYVSFLGGVGNIEPLIFEGDIIPYFLISLHKKVRWGIELSPRIIIRMYNKDSYPVLTPSYIPKVTYFHKVIDNKKNDVFLYFSWFHHSNGQNGSFYNADGSVNITNGSFSTNFIETGYFLSRSNNNRPRVTNFFKVYANYCYELDNELKSIFGRIRLYSDFQTTIDFSKIFSGLNLSGININRKPLLYHSFRLGWIAGEMNNANILDIKRIIFRYTVSYKPSFLNDVTLFAQYYYGQDYYNIYFSRSLNVLRFGIAAKTSIFN